LAPPPPAPHGYGVAKHLGSPENEDVRNGAVVRNRTRGQWQQRPLLPVGDRDRDVRTVAAREDQVAGGTEHDERTRQHAVLVPALRLRDQVHTATDVGEHLEIVRRRGRRVFVMGQYLVAHFGSSPLSSSSAAAFTIRRDVAIAEPRLGLCEALSRSAAYICWFRTRACASAWLIPNSDARRARWPGVSGDISSASSSMTATFVSANSRGYTAASVSTPSRVGLLRTVDGSSAASTRLVHRSRLIGSGFC